VGGAAASGAAGEALAAAHLIPATGGGEAIPATGGFGLVSALLSPRGVGEGTFVAAFQGSSGARLEAGFEYSPISHQGWLPARAIRAHATR
jgi:hypothetical protein